jgi:hypothetical protein
LPRISYISFLIPPAAKKNKKQGNLWDSGP